MVLDMSERLCKDLSNILGREVDKVINSDNELRIIFKNNFNKLLDTLIFKYAGSISGSSRHAITASQDLLNIIQRDLDNLKNSHKKFLRDKKRDLEVYLWKNNIPNMVRLKVQEIMEMQ